MGFFMAKVKCVFCGQTFDRDAEDYVQVRYHRYAHRRCAEKEDPQKLKEESDRDLFYQYIKELFGPDYDYVRINRLAEGYQRKYGYTFNGMYLTLKYFYEIRNGIKGETNESVGIIPYVYEQAKKYYYQIHLAQEKNKSVILKTEKDIVRIKPPRARQIKKLWFEGEEE